MTLLVRDEEDIIRDNIEYHLAQGVDFIIATDNLSVDATTDILREYESLGVLHYIFESEDNYNQHAWVTRMARMACTEFGADWVINNDADEFWWPQHGDLKATFAEIPSEINIVEASRHNFVVVDGAEGPFWSRMVYREKQSLNPLGNPLPPKVAHRGLADVHVAQGNHSVEGFANLRATGGDIEILHFPIRSYAQIENKIAKGGAAYARNRELPESTGITWRKLFEQLQSDSSLTGYFEMNYYDGERLAESLATGHLVEDRRLASFLRAMAAERAGKRA